MDAMHLVRSYIDAWNRHDGPAIVNCFADGGIYEDPAIRPGCAAHRATAW